MATSYTSDKKIGALDPITGTLSATDEFVVNKNGDTLKTTVAQVEEAMFAAKTSGGTPQSGDVVVVRRGSLIRQLETQNLVPDGAITKEKIAAAAGIEDSKLAKITSAGKVGGGAITDGTIGGSTAVNTSGAIATSSNVTIGGTLGVTGAITATGGVVGNVDTATKLSSNRNFSLTGNVTGSVSSDLTSGASIATTIAGGAVTLANLVTAVQQALVPAGAVQAFAMNSAPNGWLAADGSNVSRSTYAALFSAIGTTYGAGDGSTTFALPDLRGYFLRGSGTNSDGTAAGTFGVKTADALGSHNHTASSNSTGAHTHTGTTNSTGAHTHTGTTNTTGAHAHNYTTRTGTSPQSGTATQCWVGTANGTTTTNGDHSHTVSVGSAGDHSHTVTVGSAGDHSHTITVSNTGGTETRPKNIAMLYCIKF